MFLTSADGSSLIGLSPIERESLVIKQIFQINGMLRRRALVFLEH